MKKILYSTLTYLLFPLAARASDPFNIFAVGQYSLPTGRPPLTLVIVMIINTILSFVGVIVLVMIIYSGYQWMTAAGNDEKVAKAKSMLIGAVIGLVIVMTSLAVVKFAINNITKALQIESNQNQSQACVEVGQVVAGSAECCSGLSPTPDGATPPVFTCQ
jgi:D-alanyl-lipoteichoic acid acyltransferase DltB (MBOAT superfamily)